jgi:outer membrane protein OmpA-like peptidoglycan-associated protein
MNILILFLGFFIILSGSTVQAQIEIEEDGTIKLPGVVIDEKGIRIKSGTTQSGESTGSEIGSPGKTFISRDLRGTDFSGQDLSGALFENTDLRGCNFSNTKLKGAIFRTSDVRSANFREACLVDAQFLMSDLRKSNFTNAILIGTKFSSSDVGKTIATGAVYEGPAVCDGKQSGLRQELTKADQIKQALSEGVGEKIDLTINFDKKSATIKSDGHVQIFEIANALKSYELKGLKVRIEGHTDSTGSKTDNLDLSYRRALAVLMVLVKEYGISHDRLYIKGYGELQPIYSNKTSEGRALNRRVTLVNLGE